MTSPSPPQTSTNLDSPDLHGRSSFIFSGDTVQSHPTTYDNEKYSTKGQHIEQTGRATTVTPLDDLDHVTEFPNKWSEIRLVAA
jgi:hypothetical protein